MRSRQVTPASRVPEARLAIGRDGGQQDSVKPPHGSTGDPSDDAVNALGRRAQRRPAEAPELRTAVGARIAALRASSALTQDAAAARLGRRKSWLAKIERGQRSVLFSEAVELATLFGVTLGELWPHDMTGRSPSAG